VAQVVLEIDDQDFWRLYETRMFWCGGPDNWPAQSNRFTPTNLAESIDWNYRNAYWMGEYANVILARAYLVSVGHEYQVLWDDETNSYVILTDFREEDPRDRPADV